MRRIIAPSRSPKLPAARVRRPRRAFTLLELLVVISIIVIAVSVLVPAFGRIIESSNYASAVNSVTVTLGNARALAIQSGRPTGVAFLFDTRTQKFTLMVLESSGEGGVLSNFPVGPPQQTYCSVFRPATGSVPVELPRGMGVYAISYEIEDRVWFIDNQPTHTWYAGESIVIPGRPDPVTPWIFPRNDGRMFTEKSSKGLWGVDPWDRLTGRDSQAGYDDTVIPDSEALRAVRNVQTFFVQFNPDGKAGHRTRAGGQESQNALLEFPDRPTRPSDTRPDPRAYDDPLRFDPENFTDPETGAIVPRDVDSRSPNPEVVMRAASQLAVVDLNRLAEWIGRPRPWLYRPNPASPPTGVTRMPMPQWMIDARFNDELVVREISRQIDRNAEIIDFNRFTGAVMRRSAR